MNIASATAVKTSVLSGQASVSANGSSAFAETLAQATRQPATAAASTSSSATRNSSQNVVPPSLWLNGLEDSSPVNLLVDPSDFKVKQRAGRADEDKPNVAEFMSKTGLDVKEASKLLYGSLGAIPDMRDWTAIMASDNPAIAARQATSALINSDSHASSIAASLNSAGYKAPREGDIVAKSGNLTVVQEGRNNGSDAYSLRITGASGHIIQSVAWSADEVAGKMRDYGIDTKDLEQLVSQLDSKGINYAALRLS